MTVRYAAGRLRSRGAVGVPAGLLAAAALGFAAGAQAAVIEFSSRFGGGDNETITAMVVDANGNRYLVGNRLESESVPPETQSLGEQVFYAKVNAAGELVFTGSLGGFGDERANAVAVDLNGQMFIVGDTSSVALASPAVSPLQPGYGGGGQDGFLAVVAANGAPLLMSHLGGTGLDSARAVVLDELGNIYIAGSTASDLFPGIGDDVLQPERGGEPGDGIGDGFVLKLSPDYSSVVYGTYFGGDAVDAINGIAVDGDGNAYIAGVTASDAGSFPLVTDAEPEPYQATLRTSTSGAAATDAFIARLSADGSTLLYSTYLGGGAIDAATAIAVRDGQAYVTGYTASNPLQSSNGVDEVGFPLRNPVQEVNGGGIFDAFVTRLSADASNLLWSTYFGGPEAEEARSIAVNADGQVFIGGISGVNTSAPRSSDCGRPTNCIPLERALQFHGLGDSDGFIAQFNLGGELMFSTYFGGSAADAIGAVALGPDGFDQVRLHVAGFAGSADFPAVGEPLEGNDVGEAFLAMLDTSDGAVVDISVDAGAVDVNEEGSAFPVQEDGIARFRVSAVNVGSGEISGVMLLVQLTNATISTLDPACEMLGQRTAVCRIADPGEGDALVIGARPDSMGTARMTARLLRADQSDGVTINNDDVAEITIVDTSGSRGSFDVPTLLAMALLLAAMAGARHSRRTV